MINRDVFVVSAVSSRYAAANVTNSLAAPLCGALKLFTLTIFEVSKWLLGSLPGGCTSPRCVPECTVTIPQNDRQDRTGTSNPRALTPLPVSGTTREFSQCIPPSRTFDRMPTEIKQAFVLERGKKRCVYAGTRDRRSASAISKEFQMSEWVQSDAFDRCEKIRLRLAQLFCGNLKISLVYSGYFLIIFCHYKNNTNLNTGNCVG